jgi:hypothetical protein
MRLKEKLEREKTSTQIKNNYNNYPTHDKILNDAYSQDNLFLDSRNYQSDYSLNVKPRSERIYHNDSKISYKTPLFIQGDSQEELNMPHNPSTKEIISELDKYVNKTNTIYQTATPTDYQGKGALMESRRWKGINQFGCTAEEDPRDCLVRGIGGQKLPDKFVRSKSYGYRNPSEHAFDYIDKEIQSAEHTVLPFARGGEGTRLLNNYHKSKSYLREIY